MKTVTWQSPLWILAITGLIGGCAQTEGISQQRLNRSQGLEALYADSRVIVDGWIDEVIWTKAQAYPLQALATGRSGSETVAQEAGSVRLVWDDQYLYVAVELEDWDVVAEGQSDQLHHFQLGDACAVFLKPADQTWYWKLQVTPHSRMSTFWYPGRGRLGLPSNTQYSSGLRVAAKIDGTLNNWRDKDHQWTAEVAMPLRDLTARGETFGPGAAWQILVARQNYSRYRDKQGPSLTTAPPLSTDNLHRIETYVPLRLVR